MFDLNPPYAYPSPVGGMGSDFIVIYLLASKFGFIPRFIYETNVTAQLHNVSSICNLKTMCTNCLIFFKGLKKNN